jgi:hypothetical protein
MTTQKLRQAGFDIYYPGDLEKFRAILKAGGVEYEIHELNEEVAGVMMQGLAVKRISPTLKQRLKREAA